MPLLVAAPGKRLPAHRRPARATVEHVRTPDMYARKNAVLTDWCARWRTPTKIERPVLLDRPGTGPDGDIAKDL